VPGSEASRPRDLVDRDFRAPAPNHTAAVVLDQLAQLLRLQHAVRTVGRVILWANRQRLIVAVIVFPKLWTKLTNQSFQR